MTRRSKASLDKLAKSKAAEAKKDAGYNAAIYRETRNMNPACSSTLTKAMRARRIENGKRPLNLADEILTKREMHRKRRTGEPHPADHTLRHAGGSLALHELLMAQFNGIDHVKKFNKKETKHA
ncbi:MAG: hypothetical protein AB7L09_21400 [Nitrospira sp.]